MKHNRILTARTRVVFRVMRWNCQGIAACHWTLIHGVQTALVKHDADDWWVTGYKTILDEKAVRESQGSLSVQRTSPTLDLRHIYEHTCQLWALSMRSPGFRLKRDLLGLSLACQALGVATTPGEPLITINLFAQRKKFRVKENSTAVYKRVIKFGGRSSLQIWPPYVASAQQSSL